MSRPGDDADPVWKSLSGLGLDRVQGVSAQQLGVGASVNVRPRRAELHCLHMIFEPPTLRHFTARFEPVD